MSGEAAREGSVAGENFVIAADALQARLGEPGLAIVDASWYLPSQNRDARGEYEAGHIPGAVFFDHDRVVEPASELPHALPAAKLFAQFAGAMGIAADDTVVVYDGPGVFSAPRAWWMFRAMGARNVFLLDGGLDRWKRDGRPTTAEPTKIAPCVFDVDFDASRVAALADVQAALDGTAQIVDMRSAGRFSGTEPEPRPGMRAGHMPGALNLPFTQLAREGSLLPPDELRRVIENAGIDPHKPVIASCGSGVTATVLLLALETLGYPGARLYDGSWAEWGSRTDTAVATGGGKAP